MINAQKILDLTVSYQDNTWAMISDDITIESVLTSIKSDIYKKRVMDLRIKLEEGNKEYYDINKKRLPAVTFSGTFKDKRLSSNMKCYNPIVVLDIDKLDSNQMKLTASKLLTDEYVMSFWTSPSGKGIKGLVGLNFTFNVSDIELNILHKSSFNMLQSYFEKEYSIELDKSGSDITRLCFLSYDSSLVLKDNFRLFAIDQKDVFASKTGSPKQLRKEKAINSKDALHNPKDKNKGIDRKIMTDLIRYLNSKSHSITYDYFDWCRVGMAISNTFTFNVGLKYFLKLSQMDKDKYDEINCTQFLTSCYETRNGSISFGSVVFLANKKGYQTKNQKMGVGKVEV